MNLETLLGKVQFVVDANGNKQNILVPLAVWEDISLQLAARQLPHVTHLTNDPLWFHLIVADPEVLGGVPVFEGTRVPVQVFIDYLQAGDDISVFQENYPTVTSAQIAKAEQLIRGSFKLPQTQK